MKILFISDLYPIKSGESNAVRTLHNFVLEWINQGHDVDVVKPNFVFNSIIRGKALYKSGFYEFEGIKILNLKYFTPFLFDIEKKLTAQVIDTELQSKHNLNVVLNLFQHRRIERPCDPETSSGRRNILSSTQYDYDLIVAHMPSGIIFANKLAEKHNIPLVCGVHTSDIEVLTNPIYQFYFKTQLKQGYNKAKKIACRSHVLQKKFSELYPDLAEKTFVASSGVNVQKNTSPSLLTLHHSPIKVMTCANLIKRKNVDKLIEAVNGLDGFELTVVGDGRELKNLKKLARRSVLPSEQNKVKFLGKLPQEKVFDQMQNSHIFVLPSVSETFGMVYLEAMANGCVTVCTKNDGIDGIIKDGENGFLTLPTVEEIKETLLRIKDFETLDKIVENSFETVKNYTPEICAKNYLKNIK